MIFVTTKCTVISCSITKLVRVGLTVDSSSGFQALVTLTLTLDQVIRHTVVRHSWSSMYVSNFIEIGKTCLWTDYPQRPLQVQGHVTQKLGKIAKIWSNQF